MDNTSVNFQFEEFAEDFLDITSDEKKSLCKFLKESEDLSKEDLLQIQLKRLSSEEESLKVWSQVSTFKDYCKSMVSYLSGYLYIAPGVCGPLDTESYLILTELVTITNLGFPTLNSQPAVTNSSQNWRQLPFVDLFCPKNLADKFVDSLKNASVVIQKYGGKPKISIHPKHQTYLNSKKTSLALGQKFQDETWNPDFSTSLSITPLDESDFESFLMGTPDEFQEKMFVENVFVSIIGTDYSNHIFSQIISVIKNL